MVVEAPSDQRREAPVVRRLGRYELISSLAKGGMGEVYLARTRGPGGFERLVVVKCALPSLAERTQQMLLAEARLAATLQHTNIVQVHDVDTDGATVFLAMEFLHGQDLRALLRGSWGKGQPLPIDQAVAITLSVCAGLHYAHDKHDADGLPLEIVHRDVTPSNVFVTYDGSVKLIDFGIAKATTLPSETLLGTVKGKPGHMSPEQCRCEPLDRRSDVFCVGILLYELTTGKRCFSAENEYLMAKRIMEDEPDLPSAPYPAELAAIVSRALAKDRRDRYPSALALQDELAGFASALRLDVSQFALGRTMATLFADELAAWQVAQRSGQSLVDHVIKRTTTTAAIIAEPPTGTAETTPGKRIASPSSTTIDVTPPRRWWMVVVGGGATAAVAIAIAMASSATTKPPPSPTRSISSPETSSDASVAVVPPDVYVTPVISSQPATEPPAAPPRVAPKKKLLPKPPKPPETLDPDSIIQ